MKASDSSSLVGLLVRDFLRKHPSFSANPLGDWKELVGEQVARYSQPVSLKKKVLVVAAYDSVWKHHLELNKAALLRRINEKRPEPLVESILIRVRELPETLPVLNPNHGDLERPGRKSSRPRKKKKVPLRQLTEEEKSLIQSLPDPELRALATRLLKRVGSDDPAAPGS